MGHTSLISCKTVRWHIPVGTERLNGLPTARASSSWRMASATEPSTSGPSDPTDATSPDGAKARPCVHSQGSFRNTGPGECPAPCEPRSLAWRHRDRPARIRFTHGLPRTSRPLTHLAKDEELPTLSLGQPRKQPAGGATDESRGNRASRWRVVRARRWSPASHHGSGSTWMALSVPHPRQLHGEPGKHRLRRRGHRYPLADRSHPEGLPACNSMSNRGPQRPGTGPIQNTRARIEQRASRWAGLGKGEHQGPPGSGVRPGSASTVALIRWRQSVARAQARPRTPRAPPPPACYAVAAYRCTQECWRPSIDSIGDRTGCGP